MTINTELAPPHTVPLRVYGVIAAGILAISSAAILIRYAQSEGVPSLTIATVRLGLAALLLTPLVLRGYRLRLAGQALPTLRPHEPEIALDRRELALAVAAGFFLALHFATWVTSLEYTSVLISVVFVTTGPIWVALIEVFLLKAQFSRWVGVGLAVAIAGGVVIGLGSAGSNLVGDSTPQDNFIGGMLSLAGALTFAGYISIARRLRVKMPVIPYIWLVYGCGGIFLLLGTLLTGTMLIGYGATALVLLIALAVFPQLIGHSSMNYAVGYLPATIVSTISQIEPIGSAFLAFIVFRETPTLVQLLGSGIILLGVLLANFGQLTTKKVS